MLRAVRLGGSLQSHPVAGTAKTGSQTHPSSGVCQAGGNGGGDRGRQGLLEQQRRTNLVPGTQKWDAAIANT